jgi:hypothetical protein
MKEDDFEAQLRAGQLHDESIGPEGARVLVGRKFSKPQST